MVTPRFVAPLLPQSLSLRGADEPLSQEGWADDSFAEPEALLTGCPAPRRARGAHGLGHGDQRGDLAQ